MKKLLFAIAAIAFISCNDPDIGEADVKKKVIMQVHQREDLIADSINKAPEIKGMKISD